MDTVSHAASTAKFSNESRYVAPVPRSRSDGHLRLEEPGVTLGQRYVGKIIRKEGITL